jgi:CelD/BcsL family acetyltransferase involved in cellulose biosynthesis
VTVIPAGELDAGHVAQWSHYQEADPALASPFFRPEFARAVASVRRDAYVAILETSGTVRGFFPFQRGRVPVGIPLGGDRSNYQGVIADRALTWDAGSLVGASGLRIWDFHHLLTSQTQFERFHTAVDVSPYLDLTDGFDEYARRRDNSGSRVIRRLRQQARRLEREIGPLRFEPHAKDPAVLRSMMGWKSQQYRDTGSADRFAVRWNVELMERIHAAQSEGFQGLLPALYAGDQLAAVAMCVRSHHVLHYWFPSYSSDLASFSPGMLLLLELAERAQSLGVRTIDLGKGRAPYKDRLASDHLTVAEGSVLVPSLVASVRIARKAVETSVRHSPVRRPARALVRAVRRAGASAGRRK